jgi:DNA-binding NtrC family response regulator
MPHTGSRLCLVEDDPIMGESLSHRFQLENIDVDWHQDATSAIKAISNTSYSVIISDMRLPDMSGEALFESILEMDRQPPPVIFITGYGSIDQAVRLLKKGARDYITKPFDLDELLNKLRTISKDLFSGDDSAGSEPILGISPLMRRIEETLRQVAQHQASVLITGESGVGKEYAARYLYNASMPDAGAPFIAINCAALPDNLLEAELFGYVKGAFTGAVRNHRGVFERADGGTLFLDEIGEMPASMQAKLLRTIQDGVVQPVGSEKTLHVDVRLICATNRDLKKAVRAGEFREDLFYRINVIHVNIPPLRRREEDIQWFAQRFVEEYANKHSVHHFLPPISERYLKAQLWPGNIRELNNLIERSCILARQEILGPKELGGLSSEISIEDDQLMAGGVNLKQYLVECETRLINETLEGHQWKIAESAASLGISRKNLWEKMRKHGIKAGD